MRSERLGRGNPELATPGITFEVDTEHLERIRVNTVKRKPYLARGVVMVTTETGTLPFCFTAHYTGTVWSKEQPRSSANWSLNAPTPAHQYYTPIPFDEGLTKEEKVEIMYKLGETDKTEAEFVTTLQKHQKEFDQFLQMYQEDKTLRDTYSQSIKQALLLREDSIEI